jgi:uncharacterized membrane protein
MFELLFLVGFLIIIFSHVRSKRNEQEIKSLQQRLVQHKAEIEMLKNRTSHLAQDEAEASAAPDVKDVEETRDEAVAKKEAPEQPTPPPSTAPEESAETPGWPYQRPMPAPLSFGKSKVEEPAAPKKRVKEGPSFFDRALANFKANWVIWLAALSLALGGLYFIQYSIENNLIPPSVRLAIAALFGFALLIFANHLRSKPFAELHGFYSVPAAFAGAALAILFGTALATHMLYGYTEGLLAFGSIAGVAVAAIGLGLRFGPIVSVVGVLGAFVSPLLVTGGTLSPTMIIYLLSVFLAALLVERVQKWIWLSAIATVLALLWILPLLSLDGEGLWLSIYLTVIALSLICIPAFNLPPKWQDTSVLNVPNLLQLSKSYPTVLAVLGAGFSILVIAYLPINGQIESIAQSTSLVLFVFFAIYICTRAQNLDQLAAIIGFALLVVIDDNNQSSLFSQSGAAASLFLIILPAIFYYAAAFVRAPSSARPKYWMVLAALFPTLFVMLQTSNLQRYNLLSNQGELMALMLLAFTYIAGMAALLARKTQSGRFGADMFAIAAHLTALTMLAGRIESDWLPHLFAVLSITLMGLAIRFDLKFSRYLANGFVGMSLLSAATLLYPELLWDASIGQMLTALLSLVALCAAGYAITRNSKYRIGYESYGLFLIALIVAGFILKLMQPRPDEFNFFSLSLMACAASILAATQYAYALASEGILRKIRMSMAIFYAVISGANMLGSLLSAPLFGSAPIVGPFPLDNIMLAYGLPMLVIYGLYKTVLGEDLREKMPIHYPLTGLALFVMIQEVRHFWHGNLISFERGFVTGELYTYTVMLMALTFFFVGQAVLKKNENLKRMGLIFAGCTAAKVFLVDTSGMEGIARATIMVLLGFSLAAIYWLLQVSFKSNEETEGAS